MIKHLFLYLFSLGFLSFLIFSGNTALANTTTIDFSQYSTGAISTTATMAIPFRSHSALYPYSIVSNSNCYGSTGKCIYYNASSYSGSFSTSLNLIASSSAVKTISFDLKFKDKAKDATSDQQIYFTSNASSIARLYFKTNYPSNDEIYLTIYDQLTGDDTLTYNEHLNLNQFYNFRFQFTDYHFRLSIDGGSFSSWYVSHQPASGLSSMTLYSISNAYPSQDEIVFDNLVVSDKLEYETIIPINPETGKSYKPFHNMFVEYSGDYVSGSYSLNALTYVKANPSISFNTSLTVPNKRSNQVNIWAPDFLDMTTYITEYSLVSLSDNEVKASTSIEYMIDSQNGLTIDETIGTATSTTSVLNISALCKSAFEDFCNTGYTSTTTEMTFGMLVDGLLFAGNDLTCTLIKPSDTACDYIAGSLNSVNSSFPMSIANQIMPLVEYRDSSDTQDVYLADILPGADPTTKLLSRTIISDHWGSVYVIYQNFIRTLIYIILSTYILFRILKIKRKV